MAGFVLVMAKIDPARPAFLSRQVRDARLFFRDLRPARTGPLRVVCGGLERCAPDYRVSRAGFTFHAVEFVWGGAARGRWRGRPFDLGPGTVFAYGPRVAHTVLADARRPPVKYFLDFTGREAASLLAPLLRRGPGQCTRPEAVRFFFEELIQAGRVPGRAADERCAALLRAQLLTLAEETAADVGPGAGTGRATYQRVRELLDRRGLEITSLAQLSREAHLDPAYLCRLFRAHSGESPYRALQRLRFSRAAEHLLQPGARVKDAAAAIGWSDPYQFSRAFKRIHGLSPQAFQRYRHGETG